MVTKTLKNLFQNHKWAIPTWLLVLTILAYGLLTPTLGFYFDDWPVIYMIQSGANFWDFYQFDRPFSAWTYVLTAPILGTSPFLWHTFTLLLRWTTTLLLWWVLGLIWPGKKKETTWIAMLFAVHPVFLQQSIAVAYSQHFITYALFFLSCWAMLRAALRKGRRWVPADRRPDERRQHHDLRAQRYAVHSLVDELDGPREPQSRTRGQLVF